MPEAPTVNATALAADSHAIIMLRSALALPADGSGVRPLDTGEWSRLAAALKASAWRRPGALLGQTAAAIAHALDFAIPEAERFAALLSRHAALSMELDRLAARGIHVLTRVEPDYPDRFKQRLGTRAPAVLFVAGVLAGLAQRTLAVTGSRDLDSAGATFARLLGEQCAGAGVTVVSGAARGADREAMNAALAADGRAVGVLADGLQKQVADREAAALIQEGRLTLLTPFLPDAGFEAAHAHDRNRLIYSLGDIAAVVSSDTGKGGTWSGATEALRERWAPVFVRDATDAPPGNAALLRQGALPLMPLLLAEMDDIHAALLASAAAASAGEDAAGRAVRQDEGSTSGVINDDGTEHSRRTLIAGKAATGKVGKRGASKQPDVHNAEHLDLPAPPPQAPAGMPLRVAEANGASYPTIHAGEACQRGLAIHIGPANPPSCHPSEQPCTSSTEPVDLFDIAWPLIAAYLHRPHPTREVAAAFGLEPAQAQRWLRRAADHGLAELVGKTFGYRAVTADRPATVQAALL